LQTQATVETTTEKDDIPPLFSITRTAGIRGPKTSRPTPRSSDSKLRQQLKQWETENADLFVPIINTLDRPQPGDGYNSGMNVSASDYVFDIDADLNEREDLSFSAEPQTVSRHKSFYLPGDLVEIM
jgi:hypothetical protein